MCTPLIADQLIYCYEKDCVSKLHKSKTLVLVDTFYDISQYFHDTHYILTIDNYEFELK